MKRLHWPAMIAAFMLMVPLAVGGGLAVLALEDSPLEAAGAVEPTFGVVESARRNGAENTSARYVAGATRSVTAQSDGVVTRLSLAIGEPIVDGSVPFDVDGLPVVAYNASAPLFRDIERGMSGDDVATAQRILQEGGLLAGDVDGIAGDATEKGIAAFNREHGYGKNNRTLSIASFVWIPKGAGTPASVTIRVGDPVSRDTEVYVATTEPSSIEVDTPPAAHDRVITVDGVAVTLPAGQTEVTDPDDVSALKEVVGDEQAVPASVALADDRTVGTVPVASVVTDPHGETCIFTDMVSPGIIIDAASGTFGTVDVEPSLIDTPVLLNPRVTRTDLSCG